MSLFDRLFGKQAPSAESARLLTQRWTCEGVTIRFTTPLVEASVEALQAVTDRATAQETFLAAYLSQLVAEELCLLETTGVTLGWDLVYELKSSPEHCAAVLCLDLPAERELVPILDCRETLADAGFEVLVDGWAHEGAEVKVGPVCGAVVAMNGQELLLTKQTWLATDAIRRFALRGADKRTQHENELAWGSIRAHADAAGAFYKTPYLETTFVLTPQTLRMPLTREETNFGRVLMVEPTFAGAPAGWLKAFDGFNSVQAHYDITAPSGGLVRVVLSEPVRKVLEVIKREMPARRVAGSRAERFIHNPWAFLGAAADGVILADDFDQDKSGAGALAAMFATVARYHDSRIERVDLVVTEHFYGGAAKTQTSEFASVDELERFAKTLEAALLAERLRFVWGQFDLSVDGDSAIQLEKSLQLTHLWRTQPANKISFEDVYALDGYSGRIEGIGVAKPIYVPFIKKPSSEDEGKPGWIPGDLTPMVRVTLAGHEGQVVIPLSQKWVDEFEEQVKTAETSAAPEVANPSLPTAVGTAQARTLVDSFRTMLSAQDKVKPESNGGPKPERVERETLLVKMNFHGVDYAEERKAHLALPANAAAVLPQCLLPSIGLKKHQVSGIAWFQHLVSRAPADCRGALLADDMGLGKTLQLLTVLGWYYETTPRAAPSLILAPKSLVDNWAAETKKFFDDSFPAVLVLYGEELRERKQPLGLIDQQLQSRGVNELLKPDWAANAKVIITTYEVLTSYEFSFARQPFAFVICDEAQRIKTPGTHASIAARALKADFRIACTGTPVENSLADLWCLFDFVQPGLLGGLEEFGRTYRRPIECDTDEQKSALLKLQEAIKPQTLRRTKHDIRDELKKKYFAHRALAERELAFNEALGESERLEVPMSAHQSLLYLGGLKKLQDANKEGDGRRRARLSFGALHLMKAVCAEPYCLPGMKFLPDKAGRDVHLLNSPKLAWLIERLERIKQSGEKAIIFTELREVQAALFYFMKEVFGLKPSIINGDSQNRQTCIERFSATQGFNVIILSTLAAGAGLNVTAANHVFHFTRAWNSSKESQATDRAHRIGQQRDVYVYSPLIVCDQYDTFDVRLDVLLRRKAGLADATVGNPALASMLNGAGREVTFNELVKGTKEGAEVVRRYLTMDDVDRMDGFGFEVLCKLLWSKSGYLAQVTTKRGGDGGIDVIAFKGRDGELLQCKSSRSHEVGWDAIKEVTTGAALYQARFSGTKFRRLAVTNQTFTSGARAHALANRVALVERPRIEEMLGAYPIHNYEFEEECSVSVPLHDAA